MPEPVATVTCSGYDGCQPSTDTSSGTMRSGVYTNDANYNWLIASPGGAEISFYFKSFATEAGYDFAWLYACSSSLCAEVPEAHDSSTPCNPPCLAKLDGLLRVPSAHYMSSTGYLRVILTTDGGVDDDGFSAVWTVKRKTLDTMLPGEGRLCHPQTTTRGLGIPSPNYPDGPKLQDCPADPTRNDGDGRLMRCEPLDPIFCPLASLCDEWDCKCYGPGKNDNSTIAGTLGGTVYNGDKSTLSCGCPTYSGAPAGGTMTITTMPFVNKADQHGDWVMSHECCADWFHGYQCTKWDYSNGSTPVFPSLLHHSVHLNLM